MVWKDGRAKPGWSSSHMHDALLWIPPAPITSKRGGVPPTTSRHVAFRLVQGMLMRRTRSPAPSARPPSRGWIAGRQAGVVRMSCFPERWPWSRRGHVLVHDPRIRPSDPSSRKQGRCPGLNGGHRVSVGQRSGRPGVGVGSEWGESIRFEWMGSVSICLNRAGGGTDRSTTRRERPWTIETVETLDSNDPGVERSLT